MTKVVQLDLGQKFKVKKTRYIVGAVEVRSGSGSVAVTNLDTGKETTLPALTECEPLDLDDGFETPTESSHNEVDVVEEVKEETVPWWKSVSSISPGEDLFQNEKETNGG